MLRTIIIAATLGYLLTIQVLRFRRRDSLSKYGFNDRASLKNMSLEDAFRIQLPLAELEFPRTFSISVFFAIFKTYGIPSISKLLAATGQLSNPNSASKRAADTGILIVEAVLNEPGSDRNLDAVARMNYLHDRYRKAGKIADDDMLYTLSLFCLEPVRWTRKFEWRSLTQVELCAMGVYWKSLGDQMNVPYHRLKSSGTGWTDGLHWLEELNEWSTAYEIENMLPADTNHILSAATIDLALANVPRLFHSVVRQYVSAFLDERLRIAMKLQQPSRPMAYTLSMVLNFRKLALRHLCLPRRDAARELWFSQSPDPRTGRFHATHYVDRPWYIEPSLSNRWHIVSWILWSVGGAIPSKDNPENRPEGYKIADLGPENMEGKGIQEMDMARSLLAEQVRKCPFAHMATG